MKRALITSGGGAKGAFSVGALIYLAQQGINRYDIISGTSTGSLIAAMAAADELDTLKRVYSTVTNDDILLKQNVINNFLFNKPFLFSTDPLQQLISSIVTDSLFDKIMSSATSLCLTAVSLQTGQTTVFCTKPDSFPQSDFYTKREITTRQRMLDALLASSNQAGFLPPVSILRSDNPGELQKEQYVDGGNRDVIPVRVAIDQKPDELYVLSNNPRKFHVDSKPLNDILSVVLRAISIFIQEGRDNDFELLKAYKGTPGIRSFEIEPNQDLDPENPTGLRFNQSLMSNWMRQGELKAEEKIPPIVPPAAIPF